MLTIVVLQSRSWTSFNRSACDDSSKAEVASSMSSHLGRQCACESDALLLAARQLHRPVRHFVETLGEMRQSDHDQYRRDGAVVKRCLAGRIGDGSAQRTERK